MAKTPMATIKLCIGSSCHLRGAYDISDRIQQFLANQAGDLEVEFMYSFCMDDCANGVCMTIVTGSGKDQAEVKHQNVAPNNIEGILAKALSLA